LLKRSSKRSSTLMRCFFAASNEKVSTAGTNLSAGGSLTVFGTVEASDAPIRGLLGGDLEGAAGALRLTKVGVIRDV
jgi:hypothetical protein